MVSQIDLAWAAGFHEGEGCIHLRKTGGMVATASQVDPEPLMKLQEIFGGSVYGPKSVKGGNQEVWVWSINNVPAVRHYVYSILPWLSERRGSDALQKIEYWQNMYELKTRFCSKGHYKESPGRCGECEREYKRERYYNGKRTS